MRHLKWQLIEVTNDLNEREEQVMRAKRSEAELQHRLEVSEKMISDDSAVRMQLGRRLEQVLMEKEEIKEELFALKVMYRWIFTNHL